MFNVTEISNMYRVVTHNGQITRSGCALHRLYHEGIQWVKFHILRLFAFLEGQLTYKASLSEYTSVTNIIRKFLYFTSNISDQENLLHVYLSLVNVNFKEHLHNLSQVLLPNTSSRYKVLLLIILCRFSSALSFHSGSDFLCSDEAKMHNKWCLFQTSMQCINGESNGEELIIQ